jgi:hypothetical protein
MENPGGGEGSDCSCRLMYKVYLHNMAPIKLKNEIFNMSNTVHHYTVHHTLFLPRPKTEYLLRKYVLVLEADQKYGIHSESLSIFNSKRSLMSA